MTAAADHSHSFFTRITYSYLSLASSLFLLGSARAATVSETLNITSQNISPDGFNRTATVVNGQMPGPLIAGNIGDHFELNVVNQLTDPNLDRATSVHWHGIFQAHSNDMDGVSFVNQCPIVPGHSFLYDFVVPDQSGTYWYHSHYLNQYCDGLRGPLVLYDPDDPLKYLYDVDNESTIISITDWYHLVAPQIFPNPGKNDPISDATLINGLGRFAGGPASPLSVVNVTEGLRYRFRLISMACLPEFLFSIDGHNLTVIEVDGVEIEPYTVDTIEIDPGQRYSVVVTADKPIDNYWIWAIPLLGDGDASIDGGLNSAILRYHGAPDAEPTNTTTIANPVQFFEGNAVPLTNATAPGEPFPGGADVDISINIVKDIVTGNYTINNVSFIPPSVPVLLQILSGAVQPGSLLPNGSIYYLPPNKTVEINFPGAFPHPFHLHGHNFDVVRVANSSTLNYVNPIKRDTVNIGQVGDNVTFRFTTNNPGPWFLHCHIDWHLSGGLAIVFAEDAEDVATADPVTQAWEDLCPLYAQLDPDAGLPDVGLP